TRLCVSRLQHVNYAQETMNKRRRVAPLLLKPAGRDASPVTENFILSGYRFPDYSLLQCLVSAFRPTNETGNFWTHFLPIFVFAFHFLEIFEWEGAPTPGDPFFYPAWNYFIGVFYLLLASSLAHLLNSMSLIIREICFFVDYGTISAYTLPSLTFYIPCSCLVAIICVMTCCNTRQRWRRYRYAVRTLVFLLPFFISSTPVFYRLLSPLPSPPCPTLPAPPPPPTMASFFYRHCFWLLVSALFNISKVPERFSPGNFDIWGHSHQWFHCCTFLSILDELHMIKVEMRALLLHPSLVLSPAAPPELPGPTLSSTYGVMMLLQGCIASIIIWFGRCAYQIYAPQQKLLKTQ
uniref:Progestin and adipoQ receptor family member 9 n=1 Tax=Electrophorus electricus TaxID=8005 RepID=A0AAY5EZF9_ELEEL